MPETLDANTSTVVIPPSRTSKQAKPHVKPKFNGSDKFLRELRKRVDGYFEQTGYKRRDCPSMYAKTAIIAAWFAATYLSLMFLATSWWAVIPLAVSLGLSVAAIGFNIQHDGGHKGYSDRPWVNKIMALSIDVIGGSSYLWNWKHNSIHHTYTNITGHDDDINVGFLGRLSPHQPRRAFHRLQHVYLWFLYGFIVVKWHFFDDFHNLWTGRIGGHKIPRPKGKDLVEFVAGKVAFFTLAFVLPMLLHPVWAVIGVYLLASFVNGVVLSVVFQLAHVVEEADFPMPVAKASGVEQIENEWAIHQVETTVDFARGSRIACWYLGGLNFQVEHHLFNRICHVHYPALSRVVEEVCKEHGVRYSAHPTFLGAVGSHFRWLKRMGQPDGATA
jgi:linoleoyl-CoA desaturase